MRTLRARLHLIAISCLAVSLSLSLSLSLPLSLSLSRHSNISSFVLSLLPSRPPGLEQRRPPKAKVMEVKTVSSPVRENVANLKKERPPRERTNSGGAAARRRARRGEGGGIPRQSRGNTCSLTVVVSSLLCCTWRAANVRLIDVRSVVLFWRTQYTYDYGARSFI